MLVTFVCLFSLSSDRGLNFTFSFQRIHEECAELLEILKAQIWNVSALIPAHINFKKGHE